MKEKQNNRRGLIFVFAILFLIIAVSVANARVERNYKNTAAEHINMVIDSIDFRDDLTRVYARMIGRPHTSQKIERVEMRVAADRWEDDGVIPVEIDFKAMAPVKSGTLIVETARGVDSINFTL